MTGTASRITRIATALMLSGTALQAQQPTAAEPAALPLWPGGAPGAVGDSSVDRPTITPYLVPEGKGHGAAVVVFPGGAYQFLSIGNEGTPMALWLNSLGVSAFVVRYRLGPRYHDPAMLQDAQRAIRMVRAKATEWHIDTSRVGVMGSSAGGHLASTTATHYDAGNPSSRDPIERMSSKPAFAILVYPVITMDARFTHAGSRRMLLGPNPDSAAVRRMSNELQVTHDTPPTFLVATTDDAVVPVQNSIVYFQALRDAHVPVEMHIFETGRHGYGLGGRDPQLSAWPRLCEAWLRHRGVLGAGAGPATNP